jgi:hypothetical protein
MIGADIRHFVFLENAEHTLKIIKCMLSIGLTFLAYAQCNLNKFKRMLSIICRNKKNCSNFKLTLSIS